MSDLEKTERRVRVEVRPSLTGQKATVRRGAENPQ
jgi:hypothetical protein